MAPSASRRRLAARTAVPLLLWVTAVDGAAHGEVEEACECLFQGQSLSTDLITNYPEADKGKYKELPAIAQYGTMCAPWDQMPGTPWADYCKEGTDFSGDKSWCQAPWCYVGPLCSTAFPSSVFKGSGTATYSYAPCGATPNCFETKTGGGCPYMGTQKNKIFKDDCKCSFHGKSLPDDLINNYPEDNKGKYKDKKHIRTYGTTCSAWDQSPGTPWFEYCPLGADWCKYTTNWCQEPWCYVDSTCKTGVATTVFKGSTTAMYSYDTCLSTPDCYTASAKGKRGDLPAACPFDKKANSWNTGKACANKYSPEHPTEDCTCIFQGMSLSDGIIENYPLSKPGQYKAVKNIKQYGTQCAPWDQMPGSPWFDYCKPGTDFTDKKKSWCQTPWCYVGAKCKSGQASSVFKGSSTALYSYKQCGNTPDCYSNDYGKDEPRCPYMPNMGNVMFKSDCKCMFHGKELPDDLVNNYPTETPGKYKSVKNIKMYGTTCSAWDQMPGSPWFEYCPPGKTDWCSSGKNWCQEPWCYVESSCKTGVATDVFKGSTTAMYSYDTCLSTPDCYTSRKDATAWSAEGCPFDYNDNSWYTAKVCPIPTPTPTPTPGSDGSASNETSVDFATQTTVNLAVFSSLAAIAIAA